MNLFNKILDSRTINITTYKKSGDVVHTPVWVVTDGTLGYVRTSKSSGKVKRIKNNHRAVIATCTSSGKITGDKIEIKAEVMELSRQDYESINKKFRTKYNLLYFAMRLFRRLEPYGKSEIIMLKEK
jgi:PPOX class probable F420-dependent enzyme|tara:strand:- start:5206 stop:5586 length:381 start_codon:yes stop_codon:yes gene_type:complete